MSYSPPANTTQSAGLTHQATVYYDRVKLDRLEQMFRFASICEPRVIPQGSGRTTQMYRFNLPGANTTPSAETVGAPFNQASATVSATIEQFSDFTSSSELLILTDIAATTERMVDDVSYRAAKTVDTLYRGEFDSNTGQLFSTIGTSFAAADARANRAQLTGRDVRPRAGGDFVGVIHPFVSYDLTSDNTAGGFIDVLKYTDSSRLVNSPMYGEIGKIAGVRFLETTNVNTSGTAPAVLYSTYIAGEGGVGMIDLTGRGPSKIVDPRNEQMQVNIIKGGPSPADPEGNIGQYVSYWFATVAKTLDTTTPRFRIVTADSSLV